jgi:hypothetical protein
MAMAADDDAWNVKNASFFNEKLFTLSHNAFVAERRLILSS